MIHKTAIIDSKAILDKNVQIGPYSIIGENVPLNIGLDLTKTIILNGYDSINIYEKLSLIGVQTILLLPTGALFVYYALKIAKKNGSLNYY